MHSRPSRVVEAGIERALQRYPKRWRGPPGKAGFSYEFTPMAALIFNYRFLTSEDMDFRDTSGAALSADGLQSHSINARIRFRF